MGLLDEPVLECHILFLQGSWRKSNVEIHACDTTVMSNLFAVQRNDSISPFMLYI